jgi:hypothetical protein
MNEWNEAKKSGMVMARRSGEKRSKIRNARKGEDIQYQGKE